MTTFVLTGDFDIRKVSQFFFYILLWCPLCVASGASIEVNLGELDDAIVSARDEPDAIQRLVLGKIQQRLQQSDLNFSQGEILYQDTIVNRVLEDGCNNTRIIESQTDIRLESDTGIGFVIDSFYEPVRLTLDLNAYINSAGRAQQKFGFRLGNCVEVASDSFLFTAIGPVRLLLSLSLELNPRWIADDTLRIYPELKLEGELRDGQVNVTVEDTVLRGIIRNFLQDEIDKLLGPDRIQDEIDDLQRRITEQLRDGLENETDDINGIGSNGFMDVKLPAPDDEQVIALYELLTPDSRFPLTAAFLESRRLEILAALILNDTAALNEILSDSAECELVDVLQIDLQPEPVYRRQASACELLSRPAEDGVYFTDSACSRSFDFVDTDLAEFCQVALDANRLGNSLHRSEELNRWSLSPGTRFDIGAASVQGKQQPYVQRRSYKTVSTPQGECHLEMRIYSDLPNTANKIPLIALHGGSWQRRGIGFLGIENMATHFVDAGFVVFAPFYRLVGSSDGPLQCNGASLDDLLVDVEDALDWVAQNQAGYGAGGNPVLFGQSSGGHLALSMAVQRPQDVERAVLFYAPTDFGDFFEQVNAGEYTGEQGINILSTVAGASIDELDSNDPLVAKNSYPGIVAAQPDVYPPLFLLHGESDSLLPFRQSVRMCNGLSGSVDSGLASLDANTSSIRRSYDCDNRGSKLHLISQGEHTLDYCVSDDLCLSGSPSSAKTTGATIEKMLDWAAVESLLDIPREGEAGAGGGSMPLTLFFLAGFLVCVRYRGLPVFGGIAQSASLNVCKMMRSDAKC